VRLIDSKSFALSPDVGLLYAVVLKLDNYQGGAFDGIARSDLTLGGTETIDVQRHTASEQQRQSVILRYIALEIGESRYQPELEAYFGELRREQSSEW
jgi:hypothetical protein